MSEILLCRMAHRFVFDFFPTPAPDDGSVAQQAVSSFARRVDTFPVVACSDYVETMAAGASGRISRHRKAEPRKEFAQTIDDG